VSHNGVVSAIIRYQEMPEWTWNTVR
jgi:hypothetical protein